MRGRARGGEELTASAHPQDSEFLQTVTLVLQSRPEDPSPLLALNRAVSDRSVMRFARHTGTASHRSAATEPPGYEHRSRR